MPEIPLDPPTRESLLHSLRGLTVMVPDFELLMQHYPSAIHPDVERLDGDVQKTLDMSGKPFLGQTDELQLLLTA